MSLHLQVVKVVSVALMMVSVMRDAPEATGGATKLPCEVASEWAATLTAPLTYFDYTLLSQSHQRAAYARTDQNTRVLLWRQHIAVTRRALGGLSPQQTRILDAMESDVSRFVNEELPEEVRLARQEEARQVLGDQLSKALFGSLGPVSSFTLPESNAEQLKRGQGARRLVDFEAPRLRADCSCSVDDDWCSGGPTQPELSCKSDGCTATVSGCGWWFSRSCNGTCQLET